MRELFQARSQGVWGQVGMRRPPSPSASSSPKLEEMSIFYHNILMSSHRYLVYSKGPNFDTFLYDPIQQMPYGYIMMSEFCFVQHQLKCKVGIGFYDLS